MASLMRLDKPMSSDIASGLAPSSGSTTRARFPARALREVARRVRLGHEALPAAFGSRQSGDADGATYVDALAIAPELVGVELLAQRLGQRHGRIVIHVGDQRGELVAAEACQDAVLGEVTLQQVRDLDEQAVARRVPEQVVHELEVVEIQVQQVQWVMRVAARQGHVELGLEVLSRTDIAKRRPLE